MHKPYPAVSFYFYICWNYGQQICYHNTRVLLDPWWQSILGFLL